MGLINNKIMDMEIHTMIKIILTSLKISDKTDNSKTRTGLWKQQIKISSLKIITSNHNQQAIINKIHSTIEQFLPLMVIKVKDKAKEQTILSLTNKINHFKIRIQFSMINKTTIIFDFKTIFKTNHFKTKAAKDLPNQYVNYPESIILEVKESQVVSKLIIK